MQKIVIVGGGFGGVKAARELAKHSDKFKVTLISDRSCFEYHASLYRSATGRSVLEVDTPLSDIFAGTKVNVVSDQVTGVDLAGKQVIGSSGSEYTYDKLILAVGSAPAYLGIKGIAEHAFSIRSINEALRFKRHLHQELEHKTDLNYVVVGGGPAGVELAAELAYYLRDLRNKHGVSKPFQISLVEAAPRILPMLPDDMSRRVAKRLTQIGVKIHTSTAVKGESAQSLALPDGNIKTHTVVWTAGVGNNPLYGQIKGLKLDKRGKVIVDAHLQAAPDVYVLGDNAATDHSGLATTAVYDGQFVARNIIRSLSKRGPSKYNLPPAIVGIPVGGKWAAVLKNHRRYYGYSGWTIRRQSDSRLYSAVLPQKLVLKAWLFGNRTEESCPVCKK